jgi:hypothetical protein
VNLNELNETIKRIVPLATTVVAGLTDSTGLSGTHDDTLAATSVPVNISGGEAPTEAEFNALLAVVRVIAQNASDTAQKLNEVIAALKAANLMAES